MLYQTLQILNIRREPRITGSNKVGQLAAGTVREIYSTITNSNGETWGQVSLPDNAGIAQWVCISNINRVYMRPVTPSVDAAPIVGGDAWRKAIDSWARLKGFDGPQP